MIASRLPVKLESQESELEQAPKRFDRETRIADDATHRECIHRIVTGNRDNPRPVGHHNMLALARDTKTGLLQRANRI